MVFGLLSKISSFYSGATRQSRKEQEALEKRLQEQKEKDNFRKYVGSRFNMTEDRLSLLTEMIETEYQTSGFLKTRQQILEEEQDFSRKYKEFQQYATLNPTNFIATSIIQRVNQEFKRNNGKKSIARIFSQLTSTMSLEVEFKTNNNKSRYEVQVNGKSQDIRDLSLLRLHKTLSYKRLGITQQDYDQGRLTREQIDVVKSDVMQSLDFYTQRFIEDMAKFGFSMEYHGFDSTLDNKYKLSGSDINKKIKPAYASEKYKRREFTTRVVQEYLIGA